jgi:hypothetical protein
LDTLIQAITTPLPLTESSKNTPSQSPAKRKNMNDKNDGKNNQFLNDKNGILRRDIYNEKYNIDNDTDMNYERRSLYGFVDHNIALIFAQKDWLYMMINCILTYR